MGGVGPLELRLQRHGLVIHVLVTKLENLSDRLKEFVTRSRNFC